MMKDTKEIGYYNQIIPKELYEESLSLNDLSRKVLNCSLCPNVNCKSAKVDIDTSKRDLYFIIDDFFEPTLDDDRVRFIHEVVSSKYPEYNPDSLWITPSYKTEGGNPYYCSDLLLEEIYLNKPRIVFYFSNNIPSLTSQISNFGESEWIIYNESYLVALPSIETFLNKTSLFNLYDYI